MDGCFVSSSHSIFLLQSLCSNTSTVSRGVVRTICWRNGIALALLPSMSTLKRAETGRCLLLRLDAIQADLLGRLCLRDKGLQRTLNTIPRAGRGAMPCPQKQLDAFNSFPHKIFFSVVKSSGELLLGDLCGTCFKMLPLALHIQVHTFQGNTTRNCCLKSTSLGVAFIYVSPKSSASASLTRIQFLHSCTHNSYDFWRGFNIVFY